MLGMSLTDIGYLALALFFNTFTAPAVKITQTSDGNYEVHQKASNLHAHATQAGVRYITYRRWPPGLLRSGAWGRGTSSFRILAAQGRVSNEDATA
jgi:hypothetical protein